MFLIMAASVCRISSGGLKEHHLGAGFMFHGNVTWWRVEGVAGLEDLSAIGVAKGQLAVDDVAPMRTLAAVVREPFMRGSRRRPLGTS
jgi:hypothetical protein